MILKRAPKQPYRILVTEAVAIALLLVVSFFTGNRLLLSWNPPIVSSLPESMYVPGLVFASGKGFHDLDAGSHPALASFLSGTSRTFHPSALSDVPELQPLQYHQRNHLYLIALQGALWRMFGISWDVTKYFLIFLLMLSTVLVYGICRLGMGPLLGFIAACLFLQTPSLSEALPVLRDLCKAPFFLTCLLLCGLLLRRKLSFPKTALLVAGVGIMAGLGLGFRRDMLILFPLCAPVAFFFPNKSVGICTRFFLLGLMAFFTALSGVGMLSSLSRESSEDFLRVICGFASPLNAPLRIQPGSYEVLPSFNDIYAMYATEDIMPVDSSFIPSEGPGTGISNAYPFPATARRDYLLALARLFPADILTRTYAAVLTLLRGLDPLPLPFASFPYGIPATMVVLLGVAAYHPWTATMILYLVIAFCGYTSLQFVPRHAFHLGFVPYFFIGTVLHAAAAHLRVPYARFRFVRGKSHPAAAEAREILWSGFDVPTVRRALRNMVLWGVLVCGICIVPLQALRWAQKTQLTAVMHEYRSMELVPALEDRRSWGSRVLFVPRMPEDSCAPGNIVTGGVKAQGRTYALELHVEGGLPEIRLEYAADFPDSPFLHLSIPRHAVDHHALLYVRVYEGLSREFPCQFLGFSVPRAEAHRVTGLYQALPDDRRLFPLILFLPQHATDIRFHATPRLFGTSFQVFRDDPQRFAAFRDLDTSSQPSVQRLLSEYENHPSLLLAMAGIHASRNERDTAVSYCLQYIDLYGTFSGITRLERELRTATGDTPLELLSMLVDQRPDNGCVGIVKAMAANDAILHEIHAGWSQFLQGDFDAAKIRFEHAFRLHPESPDARIGAAAAWGASEQVEYAVLHFRPRYQDTILIPEIKPHAFLNMARACLYVALRDDGFMAHLENKNAGLLSRPNDDTPIPGSVASTVSETDMTSRLNHFRSVPDSLEAAGGLLESLIQTGDTECLVNTWLELAEQTAFSSLVQYHLSMAIFHALSRDYPRLSAEILGILLDTTPENRAQAWSSYLHYLPHLPDIASHGLHHGRKLMDRGKLIAAATLLNLCADLDTNLRIPVADALQEAGNRLMDKGDLQGAIGAYRKSLRHEPNSGLVWMRLDEAMNAVRDTKDADRSRQNRQDTPPHTATPRSHQEASDP